MSRYSLFNLFRHGLTGHTGWKPAWRHPEPKPAYDAVIVGGGGHGLATAYYMAKLHGMRNIAVVEKGWIGGGNTGRNTTIVRSNYLWDESAQLYEKAMKLWEGLSQDLNFNVMYSPRGVFNLGHTLQDMRDIERRVNANRLNGIDGEVVSRDQLKEMIPLLNLSPNARYPVLGASLQRRGGTARHDAVAWGYARGADALGVDIIQQCEVTGIAREDGAVTGIQTTRGFIRTPKVALVAAGHSSVLAGMAGVRLPLESHPLQALVSEPLRPVLDCVVMSNAVHGYVSQSDKGELVIGGNLDRCPSYAQRGSFAVTQSVLSSIVEMFPSFATLKLMRQWGGTVDASPDNSPIIGPTPLPGLYLNCGWGTGGFKAIPAGGTVFAHLLATGEHHPLSAAFDLSRFTTGALIDESHAGVQH